jgi:hypothetical protein
MTSGSRSIANNKARAGALSGDDHQATITI